MEKVAIIKENPADGVAIPPPEVTEFPSKKTNPHSENTNPRWLNLRRLAAAGAVLATLGVGCTTDTSETSETSKEENPPAAQGGQDCDTAEIKDGEQIEHEVAFPPREQNRLNSDGIPEEVRGDTEAFKQFILEQAAQDPLTLFLYYQASPFAESDPIDHVSELVEEGEVVEGNCYSERGVEVFNNWATLWGVTEVQYTRQISFVGFNTGVDGTELTYAPGVGGKDQSGFDVFYRDAVGNVVAAHSVLDRCTQVVFDKERKPVRIIEGEVDIPVVVVVSDKDPGRSVTNNPQLSDHVQGPGAGGEPENVDGENEKPGPDGFPEDDSPNDNPGSGIEPTGPDRGDEPSDDGKPAPEQPDPGEPVDNSPNPEDPDVDEDGLDEDGNVDGEVPVP